MRFLKTVVSAHRPAVSVASVSVLAGVSLCVLAPSATAAPCDYRVVPQEGEVIQSGLSSGSSSSGLLSSLFGHDSKNQGRHPGQIPVLKGHTQAVHLLTGPGSPQRTDRLFSVSGTDLGIAWTGPDGTYIAFGDTMSCLGEGDGWRSNVLMRTTDVDYSDSLRVEEAVTDAGWARRGWAREIISSLKTPGIEHTTIPTAGIYVNGKHYMDYMSVRKWGDPGFWSTNYAATVESTDGVHWSLVPTSIRVNNGALKLPQVGSLSAFRSGNQNLQMSAFVLHDGYVYRMSTQSGRDGSAVLARSPEASFPDENSFEFFTGSGWSDDPADASIVIDGHVSELSVAFHAGLNQWVALYLDDKGMVMRTADSLEGPWSDKRMLVSRATIPDIYGGFILPNQRTNTLEWVATTWSAYNVMVMRTDLSQVPGVTPRSPLATRNSAVEDNLEVEKVIDFTPGAVAAVADSNNPVAPEGVEIVPAPPVEREEDALVMEKDYE
ncbi:DUF4185 domain-containing protein [Corynebacterium felinum]|uniref:DUF4185 domain-containing protein n=1 Tax=Corynebacterium felinum TaxID=131318 RepID=A0ABU2BDN0_9CORY|nr:DUF4185 domain-containing protein [Corynebacterium felinum]MDF5820451.1 DUF4185 domain-containing protein [Corynebacterium felinum]MDR7355489.1 hypothetical protein [Corynebacterium felinum]WJY94840.1 hypothetical protein CFELI_06095 [Corynebacterium felinum]